MLIDLHVHSHHTRGCTLAPRDVLRRAKEAGLDGVAFTDLNTLDGVEEIRAAGREEGILALVGVEIATDRGYYLCFFPDPSKVPPPPQIFGSATPWPVREVLEKVRELGGVVVAAHPYDKSIERPSGDFVFTLDGLSAIEGLNGRRKPAANDLAVEAADHMNLPCVAGSDAQGSLDELGGAATLFRDPVTSEADVVAQIRAATVYAVAIGVEPGLSERAERSARDDRRPPRHDRGGGRGGDRRGPPRGPRRGPR
jgi:predicted metal-dependent phosphoesterase TrpH